MYDTCVNVFCNITKKVLKSNGIFLTLPFMHDPSTCEREHVYYISYSFNLRFHTYPFFLHVFSIPSTVHTKPLFLLFFSTTTLEFHPRVVLPW